MKYLSSIFAIVLAAFISASGASAQDLSKYKSIDYKVRDLALIYQGGSNRIGWAKSEITPYVTHVFADGREEWIFDGYLFLEFSTGGYNGHQFTPGYNDTNATKADWEWYLKRIFQRNRALDALDKAIAEKKALIGDPGFKHKICLTCPVPIQDQKDWGELDGKQLDFSVPADRLAAGKWFVDKLVENFNAAGYENLELFGMYMICESSWGIESYTRRLAPHIKGYGLDFLWIPYFTARGAETWKAMKFDIAYLQPNHFFQEDTPDSRLDEAIAKARKYNMALELECDERALSQNNPCFGYRLEAYMDYFEKHGVWYDTPVAYYTGNHMFLDMFRKPSEQNNAIMDRLCQYIVNRRMKAMQETSVDGITAEDCAPVYYNLQGLQVDNPAGGIFIEKRGNTVRKVLK